MTWLDSPQQLTVSLLETVGSSLPVRMFNFHVSFSSSTVAPRSWQITKRFNEFAALYEALKKKLASVPMMPSKSVVRQSERPGDFKHYLYYMLYISLTRITQCMSILDICVFSYIYCSI